MTYEKYASEVYYITKKAGNIIMDYYNGKIEVLLKKDESPVTAADIAANKYILQELATLTPDIPIVSEENSEEENKNAAKGGLFWLVDPLDGTKSYIKKTGEFTVNIALINGDKPEGGAIFVPAKKTGYFTAEDGNAYKQEQDGLPTQIRVRPLPEDGVVVVASKSHRTPETDEYIEKLPKVKEIVSASSSVKLCLIAEGAADVYPRFGRTMEWDIAAGHAVLNAAGGKVLNTDGSEFIYAKEDFANPFFVASA
ncbi:MAG: 3'(2'),5'-bisphosphate nucleotidase CysQ [Rickettsiales bacterium]|nr:3'(2'),5'-bisphosphate nucleotidase CysQ [Pseudomonadota bacterium]MDA0965971.1 3'(2'),5'-bisphosphate nucleotidase CysQ [Pseudomonadota bacterium]MDG4542558.1 3'(2'),5'-bisphosphate nucleotidase CysQ [Rickettsiales bacterium]MDG4545062.1 3'(2'),5'-bisphosphate nucleotidase CysQ [Rickettsiales bacterium]MDG4547185.1 3'(2'),5'-bisphosphate nucleotidase CysQ [Rickettsiales bacterium]